MSYSPPFACDLCEVVASSDVLQYVAVAVIAKTVERMVLLVAGAWRWREPVPERMAGRKRQVGRAAGRRQRRHHHEPPYLKT